MHQCRGVRTAFARLRLAGRAVRETLRRRRAMTTQTTSSVHNSSSAGQAYRRARARRACTQLSRAFVRLKRPTPKPAPKANAVCAATAHSRRRNALPRDAPAPAGLRQGPASASGAVSYAPAAHVQATPCLRRRDASEAAHGPTERPMHAPAPPPRARTISTLGWWHRQCASTHSALCRRRERAWRCSRATPAPPHTPATNVAQQRGPERKQAPGVA